MVGKICTFILAAVLLVGCHGGGDHSVSVTRTYTIAAVGDQCQIIRQRKVATDLWHRGSSTEPVGHFGFGCWESYQHRDKWRIFLRYAIDIPKGSVIMGAHVIFIGEYNDWSDQLGDEAAFNALIYLCDYDDCGDIDALWPSAGGDHPYWHWEEGELTLIDMAADPAPVTWGLPAAGWSAGVEYESEDIKTLVQGFIDREGYTPGNHLGLIFHEGDADDGAEGNPGSQDEDAYRFAHYEVGATPTLVVTYTTPTKLTAVGMRETFERATQLNETTIVAVRIWRSEYDVGGTPE